MGPRGKVRIGFTTGSAAAAAAKAGLLHLNNGSLPAKVSIPCPEGHARLAVPIQSIEPPADPQGAVAVVVRKDAGDDPDVTHGAAILARVRLKPSFQTEIVLQAGPGVGRVTRPGLPVGVGEPAINPGPRRQIVMALQEALDHFGVAGRVEAVVEVPGGEVLAGRTFNPRLGVAGGISILGTRGTVVPFSHAAWRETILQSLDVARAEERRLIALSTGGRGGKFLEGVFRGGQTGLEDKDAAFIQAGDHVGFAMRRAASHGFAKIVWGGFWGKLVKMAQGRPQTHARVFTVDFAALADLALACGAGSGLAAQIRGANTARHVLDLLEQTDLFPVMVGEVMARAFFHCRRWAGEGPELELFLFDHSGRMLMRSGGSRKQRRSGSCTD